MLTTLSDYQQQVNELYDAKGWNKTFPHVAFRAFVELGELIEAINDNASPQDLGSEYAGLMHFVCEMLRVEVPSLDLDITIDNTVLDEPPGEGESLTVFVHLSGLVQVLMKMKAGQPFFDQTRPASQADVALVYGRFQLALYDLMNRVAPNLNLDKAFQDEINNNWKTKKKSVNHDGTVTLS